jgi:hypothetical protein
MDASVWRRVPGVPQCEDPALGFSAVSKAESRVLSKRLELSWLQSAEGVSPKHVEACATELELLLEEVDKARASSRASARARASERYVEGVYCKGDK